QPPGGKPGMKPGQGLGVFWDKGKIAIRVAGGSDPAYKDGALYRPGEREWPDDQDVKVEVERTNPDGTFVVRVGGEKVLEDKIPAFKEARGPLELWIGGWSTRAQNWD